VAHPPAGEAAALHARAQVIALGALLAEVTEDLEVHDVHRVVLDRLAAPEHDHRIDGVATDRWDFAADWEALRLGVALPATAWEGMVLPAVVAFSGDQAQKAHLELVTSQWLAARHAVDAVEDYPQVIAALLAGGESEPAETPQRPPATEAPADEVAADVAGPATARRSPVRRWLLRGFAPAGAVLAAAATLVIILNSGNAPAGGRGQQPMLQPSGPKLSPLATPGGLPSPATTALPSAAVSASVALPSAQPPSILPPVLPPSAQPVGAQQPAPQPSAGQPAPPSAPASPGPSVALPAVPPSPPRALWLVGKTATSVSLAWSPPSNGGTGGVGHYRVLRDGVDVGWTSERTAVISGLSPQTTYRFVVKASNSVGQLSGPSDPVVVTTDALPPPTEPLSSTPTEAVAATQPWGASWIHVRLE
jgi:hypothetical protein